MIIVNCPICEKQVVWSKENQYRPFCSKRCKKIDLGEWADERKKIAGSNLAVNYAELMDE